MRLAREKSHSTKDTLLVGVVAPPRLPAETDLEQLFREAYLRLHGRLIDHAERFLDSEAAADAVAQAMQELWERWPRLTPEQRNDKYIFGIVHHIVFDQLRAQGEFVSLEEAEAELDRQVERGVVAASRRDTAAEVLDEVLLHMPPRRREVLLLIKEEGFAYKEVAEILGVSEGTVNTHYRLAMETLRAAFVNAGFNLTGSAKPARLPSRSEERKHD